MYNNLLNVRRPNIITNGHYIIVCVFFLFFFKKEALFFFVMKRKRRINVNKAWSLQKVEIFWLIDIHVTGMNLDSRFYLKLFAANCIGKTISTFTRLYYFMLTMLLQLNHINSDCLRKQQFVLPVHNKFVLLCSCWKGQVRLDSGESPLRRQ